MSEKVTDKDFLMETYGMAPVEGCGEWKVQDQYGFFVTYGDGYATRDEAVAFIHGYSQGAGENM